MVYEHAMGGVSTQFNLLSNSQFLHSSCLSQIPSFLKIHVFTDHVRSRFVYHGWLSNTLVLHSIVTWPRNLAPPVWYAQPILNTALVPSVICCLQMPEKVLSLLFFFHTVTAAILSCLSSVFLKETTRSSKQRCSPRPERSQHSPYLASSYFSPLAAHWFTNTVQTRFFVLNCLNSTAPG